MALPEFGILLLFCKLQCKKLIMFFFSFFLSFFGSFSFPLSVEESPLISTWLLDNPH